MSGPGGGGSSTTVQKADPWSGIQPALNTLYGSLQGAFSNGQLSPQQSAGTQAPWDPQYTNAFNGAMSGANTANVLTSALARGDNTVSPGAFTLQRIAGGDDVSTQVLQSLINGGFTSGGAGQQLNALASGDYTQNPAAASLAQTASGAYLDPNNPAILGLLAAQSQPVVKNFQQATLPGLLSAYSAAGRFGSGANDTAIGAASDSLGQTLANLSQSTIGQNYTNERTNQLNAGNTLLGASSNAGQYLGNLLSQGSQALAGIKSNAAGQLANIQGSAISALPGASSQPLNIASILQQYLQQGSDLNTAQSNINAGQPLTALTNLAGLLQNGFALNGSSSTQSQSGGTGGILRGGLGGAASGAAIGSIIPGLGTGIGAGIGGGLGLLSGLL